MTWLAIIVLAVGTYLMKALGPVIVGGRPFPPKLERLFVILAVSLIAALIALSTFADGDRLMADAPLIAGVAASGVAVWKRAPFVVVVVVAAVVAGGLRALT